MNSERRRPTPQEKIAALKRHLLEGVPVSSLCDELGIAPTLFYRWQKEFFENGAAAFQHKGRSNQPAEQERIARVCPVRRVNKGVAHATKDPRRLRFARHGQRESRGDNQQYRQGGEQAERASEVEVTEVYRPGFAPF